MSFNLRDELKKLNSSAPVLKDLDEYSDDGKLTTINLPIT